MVFSPGSQRRLMRESTLRISTWCGFSLDGEMFRLIAKGILTARTKCVVTEACQHQRCGIWTGLWWLVPVHLVVQWLWRLKPDATGFESCRCLLVAHSQRKHLKNLILSTGCNRLLSVTITTYCHTPSHLLLLCCIFAFKFSYLANGILLRLLSVPDYKLFWWCYASNGSSRTY